MKRSLTGLAVFLGSAATAFAQDNKPDWIPESGPLVSHYFGLALWKWIGLLAECVLGFLAAGIAWFLARQIIRLRDRFASRPFTRPTVKALRRAAGVLTFAWVTGNTQDWLSLPHKTQGRVDSIITSVAIIGFVLLAYAIWDAVSDDIAQRYAGNSDRAERLLVPLTRKLVRFVIISTGILIAFANLTNVNLAALVASLGIGGVALALAAKDSVENVFGSLTILFDMPFALGDWVKIDKVEGVVEEINLRSTRIRTFEDTVITLPNANLIRAAVENFGARRVRRQKLSVKLGYDNDPEVLNAFVDRVREFVVSMPEVQADRAVIDLETFEENSVGILIQCHFDAATQKAELGLRNALIVKVLQIGKEMGIKYTPGQPARPFPNPPTPA